jgi:hypothetical protein
MGLLKLEGSFSGCNQDTSPSTISWQEKEILSILYSQNVSDATHGDGRQLGLL